MDFHQKKVQETNELYEEHADTVEKLHAALRREIPLLTQEFQLSFAQVKVLELFMADKLTLFRYLRRNQFSLPVALSLLLDTIRWRITERIDELSITHVQDLLQKPLCFFNGFDRVGRPILIIQLRYFSAYENTDDLLAAVLPLIIYLLETARKLTADLTKQRQKQNIPKPIISDLLLLVDFKDASHLPKDFSLVQTFIKVFKRYPGTAGMVNLLNFGWMYQGMWQMIKMILSQEAKSRVAFPKYKDLREMIDGSQLLAGKTGDIKKNNGKTNATFFFSFFGFFFFCF
ncbi:CRAL-TRIO domain-containing protein [Gongronella butleri]|nr:CRAL-TRIO domain-containing protein [Gongronella butleri]